jgi:hypothetical protein
MVGMPRYNMDIGDMNTEISASKLFGQGIPGILDRPYDSSGEMM